MAAWPPFNDEGAWSWTDRLVFVVCVTFLLFLLFWPGVGPSASGPAQKQIDVTVVVPPPEPNYWPAVIGAAGVLGAAGLGILYRRRR